MVASRSHYRYNWQWDYVQKYAEAHHKNLLQVILQPGPFLALPLIPLQGYQGAKETEQGKVSRLRDEAIKAAEDKKEEEKKREEEEREKKPGKDGIRVRLQMLQNRLTVQKTSDSVKQLMFERDLELEMLRRKKHYQTSASGQISFFFLFQIFSFLSMAQICSKIAS